MDSEFSTPVSICSVPSLSMTPPSAKSSEQQTPTPRNQGGIQYPKELEAESFDMKSPSSFLGGNYGTAFAEWRVESPTSQVWKRSISAPQSAIVLPKGASRIKHVSQTPTKVDTPNSPRHEMRQYIGSLVTPKHQIVQPYDSHTRFLAKDAKDEKSRSKYTRQLPSMWSIAIVVVLLQRYIKGRSGRQGQSSTYGEKTPAPRALLQKSTSTVPISKNSDVT